MYKRQEYTRDTGAKVQCWSGTHRYKSPFPVTFGRYIGPLVKFYLATGEPAALRQALRLKDACFAHVLNARGDYDVEVFGGHTHSTTAMISSLALLGEATGDRAILKRVRRFMENGLSQIAVDFGWCIEGYQRADCVGEVNNTADILETCLVLARAGYAGYFARAERILQMCIRDRTQGGPNNRSLFYSYYLYRTAFQQNKMGYASAMGWIMFLIMIVFTAVFFKVFASKVHYESGER